MGNVNCGDCGVRIAQVTRAQHKGCFRRYRNPVWIAADPTRCTIPLDAGGRCPYPKRAHDWCKNHVQVWHRQGDPTYVGRRKPGELLELVKRAAKLTGDACFLVPNAASRPMLIYKGKPTPATHAVWEEATGKPPPAAGVVRHRCHKGEEGCIAFPHLELGSHFDNMRDMAESGRAARGTANGKAGLEDDSHAEEIRRRYAAGGISQRELAREYGLSQGVIWQITSWKTWKRPVATASIAGTTEKALLYLPGSVAVDSAQPADIEAEFWKHVDTKGGDRDACWPMDRVNVHGYAVFKGAVAHRYAYTLEWGPIPERDEDGNRLVLDHACHDPRECQVWADCPHRRCVNPWHLKAVPQYENLSPRRSSNGRQVDDACVICEAHGTYRPYLVDDPEDGLICSGHYQRKKRCGRVRSEAPLRGRSKTHCSRGHPWEGTGSDVYLDDKGHRICRHCARIRDIKRNPGRVHGKGQRGVNNPRAVLDPEKIRYIRRHCVKGRGGNSGELAARFGVDRATIRAVARGDAWSDIE